MRNEQREERGVGDEEIWLEEARGEIKKKNAQLLLEHSASVHLQDKEGRTPFQVALARGHEKVTQLLSGHSQSRCNTISG